MNKSDSRIEATRGESQSAFAFCKRKAIIQNRVRRVDREAWSTCERRLPCPKPQPVIWHPFRVLSREQNWNLSPGVPICSGSYPFQVAHGVQLFSIGQSVSKSSNCISYRVLVQLFAYHSLLSFEFRAD